MSHNTSPEFAWAVHEWRQSADLQAEFSSGEQYGAYVVAAARGLARIAPGRAVNGSGAAEGGLLRAHARPQASVNLPAARPSACQGAARVPFLSSVRGISDEVARANTLRGRIRAAMPFRPTPAEVERVTREVTAQFDKEYL